MPRLFQLEIQLKCTHTYHLCTLYRSFVSFMQYQLLTNIEPTTKSLMLTKNMNSPQIKLLTGAILMTS